MPATTFDALPDTARVWVFAATQPVLGDDAAALLEAAERFLHGWAAHGSPVVGAMDWRHDHFLIMAADEEATGVSGCSVDSLYNALKGVERKLGVSLLDSSRVWFRGENGAIRVEPRPDFRKLVEAGEVSESTPVFDNTVGTMRQVRGGQWERPFAESWHGKAFGRRR